MPIEYAGIAASIAAAEQRVDAIEVLCSIITGQAKAERRELQAIRSAIDSPPVPDQEVREQVLPSDISAEMLD